MALSPLSTQFAWALCFHILGQYGGLIKPGSDEAGIFLFYFIFYYYKTLIHVLILIKEKKNSVEITTMFEIKYSKLKTFAIVLFAKLHEFTKINLRVFRY